MKSLSGKRIHCIAFPFGRWGSNSAIIMITLESTQSVEVGVMPLAKELKTNLQLKRGRDNASEMSPKLFIKICGRYPLQMCIYLSKIYQESIIIISSFMGGGRGGISQYTQHLTVYLSCLSLSISLSLYVCLSLSLCLALSLTRSLSVSLCLSLSVSLCLALSLIRLLSPPLSVTISVSLCLSLSLSL